MERVVAAGGQQPVHVDQVAHTRHLGRQDDLVVAHTRLFRQFRRASGRLKHGLDHHVAGIGWFGGQGVGIHQLGQDGLVQGAPVDADPDRLVVVDGDLHDRREVFVVAFGADVARIDPIFGEGGGHLRVFGQELVAVVVEVADDGHVHTESPHLADHLGDGGRGRFRIHGDAHELRSGMGQPGDLDRGPVGVSGVRVGHRLDDDRMRGADQDATDIDTDGRVAGRPKLIGRAHQAVTSSHSGRG